MPAKKSKKNGLKTSRKSGVIKHKVQFKYFGPDATEVILTGEFNKWNPVKKKMKKNEKGEWVTRVILAEGDHPYKYIVNGNWVNDPGASKYIDNGMGTTNSVKVV